MREPTDFVWPRTPSREMAKLWMRSSSSWRTLRIRNPVLYPAEVRAPASGEAAPDGWAGISRPGAAKIRLDRGRASA